MADVWMGILDNIFESHESLYMRKEDMQLYIMYRYICISYDTPLWDMGHHMVRIYALWMRVYSAQGWSAYIPAISRRGGDL